jgi:hypothetical protein
LVCLVTEEEEKKREIEKCVGSCLFASFFFGTMTITQFAIDRMSFFSFNAFKENEGEKKKGKQINE